jgi:hypothetical protein
MTTEEKRARDAERSRAYRAANRDKIREANRRHYLANREKRLADAKRNHDENREARLAQRQARRRDPVAGPALRAYENAKKARWVAAHPEEAKAMHRRAHEKARLATHGLTPESYAAMLVAQEGACAICRREFDQRPCIDHDHETGAVRGLLCRPCNSAIGLLRDDTAAMLRAVEYLGRSR